MDPIEARHLFPLAIGAGAVLRDLAAANVIARTHLDFVRLSPHFYKTEEEVDRVLEMLSPERVSR